QRRGHAPSLPWRDDTRHGSTFYLRFQNVAGPPDRWSGRGDELRGLQTARMNRRGFLAAAGAGLGLAAVSLPPQMLGRMTGDVLPASHTPNPTTWSDNSITLAWLGHATVLINFYGVRVLTDPALFPRIGVDVRLTTVGPLRLTACALPAAQLPDIDVV